MTGTELQELQISVKRSPETNDHEVSLLADGNNLIARFDSCMMGLDPDDILVDPCPLIASTDPHVATIARCGCGDIGCGSVEVEIQRKGDVVSWRAVNGSTEILFRAKQYETETSRALNDLSWETSDRTAARLISKRIDRAALELYGFSFSWASGRCREGMMTVSLLALRGGNQVLVSEPWDGKEIESIVDHVVLILKQDPSTWPNVEEFN